MGVGGFAVPYDPEVFARDCEPLRSAAAGQLLAAIDALGLNVEIDDEDDVAGLRLLLFANGCVDRDAPLHELEKFQAWSAYDAGPATEALRACLEDGVRWDGPEEEPLILVPRSRLQAFETGVEGDFGDWLRALPPSGGVAFGYGDLPGWASPRTPDLPLPFEADARKALLKRGLPLWEAGVEVFGRTGNWSFTSDPDSVPGFTLGERVFLFVDRRGLEPTHHAYAVADGRTLTWDPGGPPALVSRIKGLFFTQPTIRPREVEGRCSRPACPLCDAAALVASMASASR